MMEMSILKEAADNQHLVIQYGNMMDLFGEKPVLNPVEEEDEGILDFVEVQ